MTEYLDELAELGKENVELRAELEKERRCFFCCSCPQSMCVHPRERCIYCQEREDGGPVDREELANLRKCIVVGFYENQYPEYSQEWTNELQTPVTADELNAIINVLRARDDEIRRLKMRADDIYERLRDRLMAMREKDI